MAKLVVREPLSEYQSQHRIEGVEYDDFNKEYVSIHGYFGANGPHVFAAAPELLDALKAFVSAVDNGVICVRPSERDTLMAILGGANAVIAKAEWKA